MWIKLNPLYKKKKKRKAIYIVVSSAPPPSKFKTFGFLYLHWFTDLSTPFLLLIWKRVASVTQRMTPINKILQLALQLHCPIKVPESANFWLFFLSHSPTRVDYQETRTKSILLRKIKLWILLSNAGMKQPIFKIHYDTYLFNF